ncbi:hypothetical protein HanRHA438_Chr12g0567131 [Helianthus annuus]|uniref:Uncharacterized protein n=1 Tax=Helianthus annuus TaxID=4232 RepID=A0A9K3HIT6_HELAN|nr:hypothetical protein HanXRQr2_Chr12g0555731 [Helianthus annuus]KAJ0490440.1 hypothetical protein HanHA300_Chr12g0455491 [Helianthus annuus]KAJ0494645.1 hypothetical protein HanIR_Chr12g0599801 [Helianthus annuus]KAJ0506358.1 hypothetical protein HanHA89_Chr12g0481061 [Helianthus annuus]KAJ0676034.1 hypothetical protein HanLR1_Chr12g0458031 [Helianthus annuus]
MDFFTATEAFSHHHAFLRHHWKWRKAKDGIYFDVGLICFYLSICLIAMA